MPVIYAGNSLVDSNSINRSPPNPPKSRFRKVSSRAAFQRGVLNAIAVFQHFSFRFMDCAVLKASCVGVLRLSVGW